MDNRGFTIIELVIAVGIMLTMTAVVFAAIQGSPERMLVQSEVADMQQRVRVAIEAIAGNAVAALEVRPSRWGGPSEDPPGTFRSDTVTFVTGDGTTTYWLRSDPSTDTYQLTQWSGGVSADVPVVDHVVALQFAYFGEGGTPLSAPDLTGLRRLAVALRVEAASAALRGPAGPFFLRAGTARSASRWAPDLEVRMQMAPRNLNLER